MPFSLPCAAALILGALLGTSPLFAQNAESAAAPHVMAAVVVKAPNHRASAAENRHLSRELRRYEERIIRLEHHLDSLKTYADSLDRDRIYLEAAAAQARARRARIEQRLRELEGRQTSPSDASLATP